MNTVPLQKPVNQKVPLLQNQVIQKVPLQAPMPVENIKPMFTPGEAQALSAEAQAKLNSAEWLKNYRQMMEQAGPEVSDVNMRDQIAVAMRDPVYGQATATGLAAGQNMLNSWIAGANSKSRANKEKLANERWIKQMQDADDERALRLKELEESKKRIVEADNYQLNPFTEKMIRSNPELMKKYNRLKTPQEAKNAYEASKLIAEREADKAALDAAQESLPPILTSMPARSERLENGGGLMGAVRRGLNAIPGYRRLALSSKERSEANAARELKKEGANKFYEISPEDLRIEAARSNREGYSLTAGQQNKIAELVETYMRLHPDSVVKQSVGNNIIVVASPDGEPLVITPKSIDRLAKQFDIR